MSSAFEVTVLFAKIVCLTFDPDEVNNRWKFKRKKEHNNNDSV